MGNPVITGDTTGAVDNDFAGVETGDLNDSGFLSPDPETWVITTGATYGLASINATTGGWSYNLDESHPAVAGLAFGDTLDDTFTVQVTNGNGVTDTIDVTITITGVICFVEGTLIDTANGQRPVEKLQAGDLVFTVDQGWQPIEWIGCTSLDEVDLASHETLRPVRIQAGALGQNLPEQDLWVSRQHRILVAGELATMLMGAPEVLIPAIRLVGMPGISIDHTMSSVRYYHVLFRNHQIVLSNGAPTESLLLAEQSLKTLSPKARREIETLLPDMLTAKMAPARPVPAKGKTAKALIAAMRNLGAQPLDDWQGTDTLELSQTPRAG